MPVIAPGERYTRRPDKPTPDLAITNTSSQQAKVHVTIDSNARPKLPPLNIVVEPGQTYNGDYAGGRYGLAVRGITYVNNGPEAISVPD